MRKLTLDEKISFKGIFARQQGLNLPKLEMADVPMFWYFYFGYHIEKWAKYSSITIPGK